MANGYVHNPQGPERLAARIRAIEKRQSKLDAALKGIGITIDPVTGELVVPSGRSIVLDGGDLIAAGGNIESGNFVAGSTGYRLRSNGNAEFSDLTLRGGIIGNDALSSPVYPSAGGNSSTNFSITPFASGSLDKVSVNLAVPAGYTKCLLLATTDLSAYNAGATDSMVYANAHPGGSPAGINSGAFLKASTTQEVSNSAQNLLTGLSGGTITVTGQAYTDSVSLPASASTWINLAVIALFLR